MNFLQRQSYRQSSRLYAQRVMNRKLPPHPPTGSPSHCHDCKIDYIKHWRKGRVHLQLEPHAFVGFYHCKVCHYQAVAWARRERRERRRYQPQC